MSMGETNVDRAEGSRTHVGEKGQVVSAPIAPLLLTVPEAARVLAIGRTTLYELISNGAIETVHIGRAIRIPVEATRAFVEGRKLTG